MDAVKFYQNLYQTIGNATPLGFDCGRLCGKACCVVSPDLPGMYLFPGEEALYAGIEGFTLSDAALPGYGKVLLLSCDGRCSRDARPLECRVFPFAPKVCAGEVSARIDPRGRPVCPLCHQPASALSAGFAKAADDVFRSLLTEPETAAFLHALSLAIDEYERPFL